ncbi:hypothetical protein KOW79_017594 [Hemibagrus wyckioides]|uniref:Uncharacterized protein n=1 Tax=Hemibagrus wyckioides TaxID=337641 RepID=A0A9D3NBH7_9TELE|nr:hypothetical protein KOW79_017594 [Hemibagrus wyckioides]
MTQGQESAEISDGKQAEEKTAIWTGFYKKSEPLSCTEKKQRRRWRKVSPRSVGLIPRFPKRNKHTKKILEAEGNPHLKMW